MTKFINNWSNKIKQAIPKEYLKDIKFNVHEEYLEIQINTSITPIFIRLVAKSTRVNKIDDLELKNKLPVADINSTRDLDILNSVLKAIQDNIKFDK